MTSLKSLLLAGTACALLATPAWAQTAPAQDKPTPSTSAQTEQDKAKAADTEADQEADKDADEDASTVIPDVEVRATASTPRTSIDAISYNLANDLQAANGTLADALRNVPSVDVDPQGNVSLRGDSSVTILVDGRPSPMFAGASRAQVIQQLPADQYARIEIMTNPSAAYSAEGSGGIINLITKPRETKPGSNTLGSIRANVGEDRANLGLNLIHTRDKLTLTGNIGWRDDIFISESTAETIQRDPLTGRTLTGRNGSANEGPSKSISFNGSVDYRLDDKNQITGNLYYVDVESGGSGAMTYSQTDDLGQVREAYNTFGDGIFGGKFYGGTARLLRKFNDEGHEWSNSLQLSSHESRFSTGVKRDYLVPLAFSEFENVLNNNIEDQWDFTSAYVLPKDDGSKLRAGYELSLTKLELETGRDRGPTKDSLVPDPLFSNLFEMERTIHTLYATYEKPFNEKLSGQLGLRLEQTELELNQITMGQKIKRDDFAVYPTLHLSYQIAEGQTLKGSYSRRIQRPQASQLNPFLVYGSPQSYTSGNPNLKPQETDSFELMWQGRIKQSFYQATLFYRDTSDAFTSLQTELDNGAILTRPANVGSSSAAGVELVANGPLHKTLRYNASVNWSQVEYDANALAGSPGNKGDTLSGRVSLNWQPTTKDFVQISANWSGLTITPQGESEMTPMYNLGYRRTLNKDWSLNITARDLFDNLRYKSTVETPAFSNSIDAKFGGRAIMVGLTWNFGQGQRRPEQFDFSAPAGR